MIHFETVSARYVRATREALTSVSLTAGPGVITAVVGPNGSGKSTLVRTLLRRVAVTAGTIRIGDQPLSALHDREVARQVAVVAQREELIFPMEVGEYIALGRFPRVGSWSTLGRADRSAMDAAIARTEVESLLERRVDTLSGGEWQRVRLARALAQEGTTLVLDEPTAFLDIGHEMAVFELLGALATQGQAVLLVSHHLNLVARFAHQMVLLDAGTVAAAGSPDEVMQVPVLERVYRWPLVVTRDVATGAPALVPLRSGR
jgi:iron complex transport system ATP-binding protein